MTTENAPHNKRVTNIEKDNHKFWLSHEAFLSLQELAKQRGLNTAAFLEVTARELAAERLTDLQRERIHAEAEQIRATRHNAASMP